MLKLTELQEEIVFLKESEKSNKEVAETLGCDPSYVGKVWRTYIQSSNDFVKDEEGEFNLEVSRIFKQNQQLRDKQRINAKIREDIRLENAISEYTQELIKILKIQSLNIQVPSHEEDKLDSIIEIGNDSMGIFHLSDLHFNELISLPDNQYDFQVAAQRLRKFVLEAIKIFKVFNIKSILIALTGDLLNSDRRLDEMLNMATNRAKASILSVMLLEQVIMELAQHFSITVAMVSGNESRVGDKYATTEIMMSYNYDYNIYEILRLIFRKTNINFIDCDPSEQIINVNGKNILLIHGNQLKGEQTSSIQKIIGKYKVKDISIDYVIFGHLHEARISEFYARSASLCGSNAYSDNELQLMSKASQNIHIIQKDSIHSMKIDLQNTNGIKGYKIVEALEAYNAKSKDKIIRLRIPTI